MTDGPPGSSPSLAQLCTWLQRAADEERRRLSRVLHDSAAQALAAASMNLTLLERSAPGLGSDARAALSRAQELVATSCRELGDLSYSLYPLPPGENGLAPALRWLASRVGADRLRLTITGLPPVGADLEQAAFRLVQDALAGAFVEGEPVSARISTAPGGALLLVLAGRARPEPELALTALALRQRARAVGGRLRVRHGDPQTSIEARLPIASQTPTPSRAESHGS
jgi:signal transduction histidine kinase